MIAMIIKFYASFLLLVSCAYPAFAGVQSHDEGESSNTRAFQAESNHNINPQNEPLRILYTAPEPIKESIPQEGNAGSMIGTELMKNLLIFPLAVGAEVLGFVATCALLHCQGRK